MDKVSFMKGERIKVKNIEEEIERDIKEGEERQYCDKGYFS